MEDFNSDERFLVPDSEDEDINSREPWDLISGLQALASQNLSGQTHSQPDCVLKKSQAMSSPHKKETRVFPSFDASESADESKTKNAALAYDTISSDIDSGESSHNQTVIEKLPVKKVGAENPTSTPSETIGNLQFSQDVILVPETLEGSDVVVSSPGIHTAPFIVPDSPSQDAEGNGTQEDAGAAYKALSSSTNSQSSNKIDSQGLHLHFSQSQLDSPETPGSLEQAEAMFGDRGLVTTPVKDPTSSMSCRKLSLKDVPPSPQRNDPLPKPTFHLPAVQQHLLSNMDDDDEAVEGQTEGLTFHVQGDSKRSRKKQPRKQRLFMDTEEEVGSKGKKMANVGTSQQVIEEKEDCLDTNRTLTSGEKQSQQQVVASLVLTEEPDSAVMDVDQTISYEFNTSHDRSLDDKGKETTVHKGESVNSKGVAHASISKEGSPSQPEFDGFDDEDVETIDHNLQSIEKDAQDKSSKNVREDSPVAPSSQVRSPENIKIKTPIRESQVTCFATSEVSIIEESLNPDPYLFQGSQSQNVADVSNQPLTDKSRSVEKAGGRAKVVKIMRKVLKKKMPTKEDQKSSSTDESISTRPSRSREIRQRVSTTKSRSKPVSKKQGDSPKASCSEQQDTAVAAAESFTTIQSRLSNVPAPSSHSQTASSDMPPPVARTDVSRKSALASNETSPLEISKLNKKATTVSFQEEFLPKVAKESHEPFGEIERKTVRESRAIVVEKETTVDILDDKGNILKQTVTKEVTRTPIEPPWLSVSVQVTERVLSPNVSPSRSVSTLTSGDLADVSSSSLSRSISSGSKGSNPSLEFCSQSYPTPAQRSNTLESESNKAGPSGGTATTSTMIPSALAKPDSKRSSSGSNTGHDLFGSPDMSFITHCSSGNHLDRPATGFEFPRNVHGETASPIAAEAQVVDKNIPLKAAETIHISEDITRRGGICNNESSQSAIDKNISQSLEEDASDVPVKGRGKRKMEVKNTNTGKKRRQDREDDDKVPGADDDDDVGVEASGSSVSTGFIVQDPGLSGQTTLQDQGASNSKSENDHQTAREEPMDTRVDDPIAIEIKGRLLVGEQVMGKWTDGYYYPGILKKMDSVNMRYQLKFDDGSQRWVGPEGLLLAKELPMGQSVMVLSEDDYYLCGMVMTHSWDCDTEKGREAAGGRTLIYHVERDDGVMQKCPRKCLLLSEDQAACLTIDHSLVLPHDILPATTPKKGDISLDNLVEGKRQHRAKGEKVTTGKDSLASGKKSTKTAGQGDATPVVHHEAGTIRSGRKRKVGPVATSTPTPKQTSTTVPHHSATPVKPSTTDRLGGVMLSPSVSRKSPRKTRQVLFGKKLSPSPDLFKGYTFLLTHIDKSVEQRLEEKHLLGESSLEDTSLDDNGDHGSNEEPHPFIKDQLQSLILAGGGKVLDKMDMEQIHESGISQCYLVASEHQRTVKYLQALAANIKIVSHQWVLHSIDQGRLLSLKAFLLPSGISLEKRKLMECKNLFSHLRGRTVLITSSRDDFIEAWSSILSIAKCHLPTRFPAKAIKADPGIDYVISDTTCSSAIARKCRSLEVPLVSSEWIAQCLINNSLVDPASHERYRHDYDS